MGREGEVGIADLGAGPGAGGVARDCLGLSVGVFCEYYYSTCFRWENCIICGYPFGFVLRTRSAGHCLFSFFRSWSPLFSGWSAEHPKVTVV
jgi:hypothetical protein